MLRDLLHMDDSPRRLASNHLVVGALRVPRATDREAPSLGAPGRARRSRWSSLPGAGTRALRIGSCTAIGTLPTRLPAAHDSAAVCGGWLLTGSCGVVSDANRLRPTGEPRVDRGGSRRAEDYSLTVLLDGYQAQIVMSCPIGTALRGYPCAMRTAESLEVKRPCGVDMRPTCGAK